MPKEVISQFNWIDPLLEMRGDTGLEARRPYTYHVVGGSLVVFSANKIGILI